MNPNHPIVQAYATGIAAMKALPVTDPTSWLYQANIHGTTMAVIPGAPWNTCPHGSIFFLAWHRLYLFHLEKIIAAKSGMAGFALPYWNYANPAHRALPPPFQNPASPLFEPIRGAGFNTGATLPAGVTDPTQALGKPVYMGAPQQFQSAVEGTPHSAIHGTMGGKMGSVARAAQDPIFWLHHCNIDRLQERWLKNSPTHNLSTANWPNQLMKFAQPNGTMVQYTAQQTVSTLGWMNYIYDEDYSGSYPCIAALNPVAVDTRLREAVLERAFAEELLAQAEVRRRGIDLTREQSVEVPLGNRTLERLAQPGAGMRFYLLLGGLTARVSPDVVYAVNVGGADVPGAYVSFFGWVDEDRRHEGGRHHVPLALAIDITDQLEAGNVRRRILAERQVTVRLTPVGADRPDGQSAAARPVPGSDPFIGEASIAAAPAEPAEPEAYRQQQRQ